MDKKQLKQKVAELLSAGKSKTEVFHMLSSEDVKDNLLAHFVASSPNALLYEQHYKKINILITIMFAMGLFAAIVGYGIGAKIGPIATWIFVILCSAIPLLFAYGFYKNHAGTYNAYIILTIVQLPKAFEGLMMYPVATAIGLAFNLAILAYVWYIRSLLFPDFNFIGPKKVNGQYVFTN